VPFWRVRELGTHVTVHVAWAEAYLHTKWHLEPSSRLATIDTSRKVGELMCPLFGTRELGPHLTQRRRVGRGLGLHPYQVAS